MGASGSRATNGQHKNGATPSGQFVLIITAPPGVGKEELMGTFISENVDRVAYVARLGAVRATQPGLLYFYESADDVAVEPSLQNSYSTILQAMQAALQDGKSVVVDVDSAGARALRREHVPGCYVFLLPESMDTVRRNIEESLSGDSQETIERTVAAAEKEIMVVDESDLYDFGVQNDSHAGALEQLGAVAGEHGLVADEVIALEAYQRYSRSPRASPQRSGSASPHRVSPGAFGKPRLAVDRSGEGAALLSSPLDGSVKSARVIPLGRNASFALPQDVADLAIPEGMDRLHDAVAVVTGAASGVGWAACEALIAAGMRVVGAAKRKDRLQALQAQVLSQGAAGDMFLPVMCDVTREEEVRALFSIAAKTFPGKPVSVLVSAAAERPAAGGQVLEGASKAWVEMVSTNVLATGMCCREACISMRRGGQRGHIVIVGGPAGPPAAPDTFYTATQCALKGIATGLRQEVQEAGLPVKVSLLTAGAAETDIAQARVLARPQLSPVDVAGTLLSMLAQPAHVDVSEVTVRHVEALA